MPIAFGFSIPWSQANVMRASGKRDLCCISIFRLIYNRSQREKRDGKKKNAFRFSILNPSKCHVEKRYQYLNYTYIQRLGIYLFDSLQKRKREKTGIWKKKFVTLKRKNVIDKDFWKIECIYTNWIRLGLVHNTICTYVSFYWKPFKNISHHVLSIFK